MKKLVLFITLALVCIELFAQHKVIPPPPAKQAKKQVVPKVAPPVKNTKDKKVVTPPSTSFTRIPDVLRYDSVLYWTDRALVARFPYTTDVVIAMRTRDCQADYAFRKHGNLLKKIPLPINNRHFEITQLTPGFDSHKNDQIEIECKIWSNFGKDVEEHTYVYNMSTSKITEIKK